VNDNALSAVAGTDVEGEVLGDKIDVDDTETVLELIVETDSMGDFEMVLAQIVLEGVKDKAITGLVGEGELLIDRVTVHVRIVENDTTEILENDTTGDKERDIEMVLARIVQEGVKDKAITGLVGEGELWIDKVTVHVRIVENDTTGDKERDIEMVLARIVLEGVKDKAIRTRVVGEGDDLGDKEDVSIVENVRMVLGDLLLVIPILPEIATLSILKVPPNPRPGPLPFTRTQQEAMLLH